MLFRKKHKDTKCQVLEVALKADFHSAHNCSFLNVSSEFHSIGILVDTDKCNRSDRVNPTTVPCPLVSSIPNIGPVP